MGVDNSFVFCFAEDVHTRIETAKRSFTRTAMLKSFLGKCSCDTCGIELPTCARAGAKSTHNHFERITLIAAMKHAAVLLMLICLHVLFVAERIWQQHECTSVLGTPVS